MYKLIIKSDMVSDDLGFAEFVNVESFKHTELNNGKFLLWFSQIVNDDDFGLERTIIVNSFAAFEVDDDDEYDPTEELIGLNEKYNY